MSLWLGAFLYAGSPTVASLEIDESSFSTSGSRLDPFSFNQSNTMAFYYFYSVTINEVAVAPDDWVGAFNGDICVGARQWDISQCGNGVCEIPVMGKDQSDATDGYMEAGDIPSFKIYDTSENAYYDAIASENIPWYDFGNATISSLNSEENIVGCMDETACNYNAVATEDDGTCEYLEGNYECGGGPPAEFYSFNQSTRQAFYFVYYGYDIMGEPLVEGEDWIGLFNGDICVGSQVVSDAITTVPAMGDDGYELTSGYLLDGDIPHYKIYDVSEDIVYDGLPSLVYPFSENGMFHVLYLDGVYTQTLDLTSGSNLVSFHVLLNDGSLSSVLSSLVGNITAVVSEGLAANYIDPLGWIGSLVEFSYGDGYWFIMQSDAVLDVYGYSFIPDYQYDLSAGANLISFPSQGSVDLSSAIPDDVEDLFLGILGEGSAAMNTQDGWVGSLFSFDGGKGYWVIVSEDLSFSYQLDGLTRAENRCYVEVLPSGSAFTVSQSPHQAFYFVENITLDESFINDGDWLLTYNENILTGIRQWQGDMIDIPAMGFSENTPGYFNEGEIPTFKLLQQSTGEFISLKGDIPAWSENGIFTLSGLAEIQPSPDQYMLKNAYPNPFNPTTTLSFAIPIGSEVSLSIYNLKGREVSTLINGNMEAGYHSVAWNADAHASGVYFVKMMAGDFQKTQKLVLVK